MLSCESKNGGLAEFILGPRPLRPSTQGETFLTFKPKMTGALVLFFYLNLYLPLCHSEEPKATKNLFLDPSLRSG